MLAPDPIEALLRHAQRDDDIHVVAVVFLRGVFERSQNLPALGLVSVVHEVSNLENATALGFYELEPGDWVGALPVAKLVNDMLNLAVLVFRAFTRVYARDMDDR